MATPPAPVSFRPLPLQHTSPSQFLVYNEAQGRKSLLHMIDMIRQNLAYRQANKAIRAGLRPATKFLSQKLKEEIPRSKISKNPLRPSGSTARSVRAVLGAPPGRGGIGKEPIGRVVLVPPHGYVYNFLKGTGPRFAAVISKARSRGLWTRFGRGVGGWGKGPARGSMPKVFDIELFMHKYRDQAIAIMLYTFQQLTNAFELDRRPKRIQDYQDGGFF